MSDGPVIETGYGGDRASKLRWNHGAADRSMVRIAGNVVVRGHFITVQTDRESPLYIGCIYGL